MKMNAESIEEDLRMFSIVSTSHGKDEVNQVDYASFDSYLEDS